MRRSLLTRAAACAMVLAPAMSLIANRPVDPLHVGCDVEPVVDVPAVRASAGF